VGELAAPRTEHAHEARDTDLVHCDRGHTTTERDDAFGAGTRVDEAAFGILGRDRAADARAAERELAGRARERTDERERNEVDGRDLQPAGLDRGDETEHG